MRADPAHRHTRPRRGGADLLPMAARAWRLAGAYPRRAPVAASLLLAAVVASRWYPARLLEQAHLGLGGTGDIWADLGTGGTLLYGGPAACRFVLPPVVGAWLLLDMLRLRLGGSRASPANASFYMPVAKLSGFLLLLKLLWLTASFLAMVGLGLLVLRLGPLSALLTLILIAPAIVLGMLWLLRLSLAAAPAALGLPHALAESAYITRGRVMRLLGGWITATSPLILLVILPVLWSAMPGAAILAVVLAPAWLLVAGGVIACFYVEYRAPEGLRPDQRPSRNRFRRREPVIAHSSATSPGP